jgi:hypothetical protein
MLSLRTPFSYPSKWIVRKGTIWLKIAKFFYKDAILSAVNIVLRAYTNNFVEQVFIAYSHLILLWIISSNTSFLYLFGHYIFLAIFTLADRHGGILYDDQYG